MSLPLLHVKKKKHGCIHGWVDLYMLLHGCMDYGYMLGWLRGCMDIMFVAWMNGYVSTWMHGLFIGT